MNVLDLARSEIRALVPYSSARTEARDGAVMLNANESAVPPFADDGTAVNRYPDQQPAALIDRLAKLYGVRREQVLAGRGSDEGIDLLMRAFCTAGRDAVLIQPPTFGMYAVAAHIQGVDVIGVPLREDFTLGVDAVLAALTPAMKLVFVCTPNNPTGQRVPREQIERLARALSDRALLVADEAYIEFADEASAAELIDAHDNLVVLRTLSKAHALAGARLGVLLASAAIVTLLRKLLPPYPLPTPCVQAALRTLSDAGIVAMRARVAGIRAERARLGVALADAPGVREVLPSQANFLTVRFDDAGAVYARLLDVGIVVRDVRRYPGLDDALRITIGTLEENDRVLAALAGVPE